MQTFTVRFCALTDMFADIEVEAETAEHAIILAQDQLDRDHFDIAEDGACPIADTEEVVEVRNGSGEIVEEREPTSAPDLIAAIQKPRRMSGREFATILAALELWRDLVIAPEANPTATDGRRIKPLDRDETETLLKWLRQEQDVPARVLIVHS